jgi:hypothetical protein
MNKVAGVALLIHSNLWIELHIHTVPVFCFYKETAGIEAFWNKR